MSYLSELRKQKPALDAYSDEEIIAYLPTYDPARFGGLSPEQVQQAATNDSWEFTKGLKAGIDQTQALGYGLLGAVADAVGANGVRDWAVEGYQEQMAEAKVNAGDTQNFSDIDGVGSALEWAGYTLGNLAPTMATAVAGGGVGGILAKQGAKKAAASLIKEQLAKGVAKEQAIKNAGEFIAKRVATGQGLGAYGASTGMETGSIYGETDDAAVAFAHGAVAGAFDALPIARVLNKFGLAGAAKEQVTRSVTGEILKQGAFEGGTEALQTLVEQHARHWVDTNGQSLLADLGEANWTEIANAAAAGALGGGVMGAGSGALTRRPIEDAQARIEQAGQQAAEQGGDALSQESAKAQTAASEIPAAAVQEQRDTLSQAADQLNPADYDAPAMNRERTGKRGFQGLDGLIALADRMPDGLEDAARLRQAKNFFQKAEQARAEGSDLLASMYARRGNQLYQAATEANETLRAESANYPVPYVAQGELTGGEVGPYQGGPGRTGETFDQPRSVGGPAALEQQQTNRLTDSGIIFGEEPAEVRAAREQRAADDFSARYGQEGQTPYRREPVVGELDRSTELPPGQRPAELPPGTGQINLGRDRPERTFTPAPAEYEGVGRNMVERQAATATALPQGSAVRAITPDQLRQLQALRREGLRTKLRERTPEQVEAIQITEAVRAGEIQVGEAAPDMARGATDAAASPLIHEVESAGYEWKENEQSKWAWFKGDKQITGAYPKSTDKQYAAENSEPFFKLERSGGEQSAEVSIQDHPEFGRLRRLYGGITANQAETKLNEMQADIRQHQKVARREFNGNGGRRTGAAVSAQAARDIAAEMRLLKLYLAEFPPSDAGAGANDSGSARQPVNSPKRRYHRDIDPLNDDLLNAIALMGGINREHARAEGIDPAVFGKRAAGIRYVFPANGGDSFDGMAERLAQYGYINPDIERKQDFSDKLFRAINGGEKVMTPDGQIAQLEREAEADAQYTEAEQQGIPHQEMLADHVVAAQMAGVPDDVITDILTRNQQDAILAAVELQHESDHAQTATVQSRGSDGAGEQEAPGADIPWNEPGNLSEQDLADIWGEPEPLLSSYTEADLAEREQTLAAAEQDAIRAQQAAEQKAKADAELNDFSLTGSDRPADVAAATGQNDMFGLGGAPRNEQPVIQQSTVTDSTATESPSKPKQYIETGISSGIEATRQLKQLLNSGEPVTADEVRRVFDYVVGNEQSILAELKKLTKDQLKRLVNGHVWADTKKPELVERAYDSMVGDFRFIGSDGVITSSGFDRASIRNQAREHVKSLTDEQVATYAKNRKAAIDERTQQHKEQLDRLLNPQTLADYREAIRLKGFDKLTPEQRATYDRLVAEETMASRQPDTERAGLQTDEQVELGEPTEGTHGKTGETIFNVKVITRLGKEKFKEAAGFARSMGGGYYRGNFYFKSREDAELFSGWVNGESVDLSERNQQRTEQKQAQASARLKAMADRIEQQANEALNADRKENTAKRMREADTARANAAKDARLAEIMRRVAESDSTLLKGMTQKVQVELMEKLARSLKYNAPRDMTVTDSNGDLRFKDEVSDEMKVADARMPIVDMYSTVASDLANGMIKTKGFVLHGRRLAKLAKDTKANMVTLDSTLAEKVVSYIESHTGKYATDRDTAADYKRLQRMGITNRPTLRAALLEYMQVSNGAGQPVEQNRLQTLERDLQRTIVGNRNAFNDFFPTPETVAEEVIGLAEIEPGMRVLEPSAGNGMLADAAKAAGAEVDVVEMGGQLREILSEKGHNLVGEDFLDYQAAEQYDRIVMNPPFSNDQDIQHVQHAYTMLKPGGKLVAIVSSMAGDRANTRNRQFREWLDDLDAVEQPLPQGAFLSSMNQTGVSTKVLVVDKPAAGTEDDTGPRFSRRNPNNRQPLPLRDIEAIVSRVTTDWANKPDLTVVASEAELPANLQKAIQDGGASGTIEGVFHGGRVYLIANKLPTQSDVERVLFHEVLGHYGMRELYGPALGYHLERMWNRIGGLEGVRRLEKRYGFSLAADWKASENWTKAERHEMMMDELVAYIAQRGDIQPDIIQRIAHLVREGLRKLFGSTRFGERLEQLTDVEVLRIVAAARQAVVKGDAAITYTTHDSRFVREFNELMYSRGEATQDAGSNEQASAPHSDPDGTPRYSRSDSANFATPDETLAKVALRKIADKFQVLKDLQANIQKAGGTVSDDANAYRAEELFHGKAEEDLRQMRESLVKPLAEKMAKFGISQAQLDEYLYAKHAPERNAHIAEINPEMPDGGSGMTNAEAAAIIDRVRASGKQAEYEQVAQIVYDMLATRRDTIRGAGLEGDDLVDAWESSYQFYVPLKGWAADEQQEGMPRAGKGFNIGGRESKRAMGRSSEAASPSSYAIQDLTETLIRKRKNEVGNAFLKLVEDNPNPDYWQVFTDDNPEMDRRIVTRTDPVTGERVEEVRETPIPMAMMSDRYFQTKRDGKTYYIKLEDPRLMKAMKNIGPDTSNFVFRTLGKVNRFLSALNTSYNPEFVVGNFARDVQTAILNLKAEQSRDDGKVKGEQIVAQTVKDIPTAMRAVYRGLRGKAPKNAEWAQWFDEFRQAGAKTGYFDMKDIDGQAKDVERLITMANGGFKGNALKWAEAVGQVVEDINGAVENAVRLSAYVNARKAGLSTDQAASLAKNMTVNFNRRGEAGTTLNALYMFANASIQGSMNFARTMIGLKGEKGDKLWSRLNTAQKIAVGLMAGSYAIAMANRMAAGEDDDGENWYDKVPAYVKERNLVIMKSLLGGEQDGSYWKIPLPYGYNIFHVFGSSVEAVTHGDAGIGQAASDLTLAALGSFSPIGFQDSQSGVGAILKNVTPTLGKPLMDVALNENFMGSSIYNENFPFGTPKPDSSLSRRSTPEGYKAIAEFLNEVSGGSQWRSGAIDINPDVMRYFVDYFLGGAGKFMLSKLPDNVYNLANGVEMEPHQQLFMSRVNGKVLPYEDMSRFYDRRDEINQIEAELKGLAGSDRMAFYRDNRAMLALRPLIKATEKQLKALRKRRDAIYAMDLSAAEQDRRLKVVEQQMKAVVDRFNKAYRSASE